jgi:hypothetical protein
MLDTIYNLLENATALHFIVHTCTALRNDINKDILLMTRIPKTLVPTFYETRITN